MHIQDWKSSRPQHINPEEMCKLDGTTTRIYRHLHCISSSTHSIGTKMCSHLHMPTIAKDIDQRTLNFSRRNFHDILQVQEQLKVLLPYHPLLTKRQVHKHSAHSFLEGWQPWAVQSQPHYNISNDTTSDIPTLASEKGQNVNKDIYCTEQLRPDNFSSWA